MAQFVRNNHFLTELDFVEYIEIHKSYTITEKNIYIFQDFIQYKELTPSELFYILNKQQEIGTAAEIEIIKYEKKRLLGFPYLLGKIEHTSQTNVNAGYDIKSFEIINKNNQEFINRYIEVKAVSDINQKFYLSTNEIEKAELLGSNYYIYLLPVISTNKFDIESLEIIQDPFKEVLNNYNWGKKIEKYSIWKNTAK